jgi:RNA recognition motif-containing protein
LTVSLQITSAVPRNVLVLPLPSPVPLILVAVEGWVVFVTGIHEECTEDDLYDKFADFGPIKDLKMPLDHRTGYVKGYALIEYASHQEAKAAVDNMDGQTVMEQQVKCDFAYVHGVSSAAHAYVEDGQAGREREVTRTGRSKDARQVIGLTGDGSGRQVKVYHDI